MSDETTVAIPVKSKVTVQQLPSGVYLVQLNDTAPSMATSHAQMHEQINAAFGITPAKRDRKKAEPKPAAPKQHASTK